MAEGWLLALKQRKREPPTTAYLLCGDGRWGDGFVAPRDGPWVRTCLREAAAAAAEEATAAGAAPAAPAAVHEARVAAFVEELQACKCKVADMLDLFLAILMPCCQEVHQVKEELKVTNDKLQASNDVAEILRAQYTRYGERISKLDEDMVLMRAQYAAKQAQYDEIKTEIKNLKQAAQKLQARFSSFRDEADTWQ